MSPAPSSPPGAGGRSPDATDSGARPGVVRRVTGGAVRRTARGTKAFSLGAGSILRGLTRLVRTRYLWPYAVAPVLIGLVLFTGMIWALASWLPGLVEGWLAERLPEWLALSGGWLTAITLVGVGLVLFYVAFPAFVRVLAAPFLALLVDRVYEDVSGRPTPTPPGSRFVRWVLRPIWESLVLRRHPDRRDRPRAAADLRPRRRGGPLFFAALLPVEGMDLLDLGAGGARAVPLRRAAAVRPAPPRRLERRARARLRRACCSSRS